MHINHNYLVFAGVGLRAMSFLVRTPAPFTREVAQWVRSNPMPKALLDYLDQQWTEGAHTALEHDVFQNALEQIQSDNSSLRIVLLWLRAGDVLQASNGLDLHSIVEAV
jgi:hypothetical protein